MKLGLAYEMQRPMVDDHTVIEETIEQCVLADKMGFDYLWFVEHHFLTGFSMSPCPEVIYGALSRLTKRIRLGFGVVILPYHHPARVAERVAMVDHLSGGRVDFGTGRSAPYEQTGMGIDPRDTRDMWAESWKWSPRSGKTASFHGKDASERATTGCATEALSETPSSHLGCSTPQPSTYRLAAEKGIGVMALSVAAPSTLAEHIQEYKKNVRLAKPVGKTINDQWLSATMAYCDLDNKAGVLAAQSLKTFFGPDRPYLKDQVNVYERLVESWGGVPEHLQANFARYIKKENADGNDTGVDLWRLGANRPGRLESVRCRHAGRRG